VKTLVADTFPDSHLHRLKQLGCEVDYLPSAKADELPSLAASCKILVVRGKKVNAETLLRLAPSGAGAAGGRRSQYY
jgi:hypothetical protein